MRVFSIVAVLDISRYLQNQTAENTAIVYQQTGAITGGASVTTGKHQWYSIHIMNYCQGNFTSDGSRRLDECSKSTAFFAINPVSLASSKTLGPFQLSFSQTITDVGGKIENAYQAIFFFLCMGIAATGLEFLLGAIIAVTDSRKLTHGTRVSLVNLGLACIALLGLGLSSGVITGVLIETVQKINDIGADIGISAKRGDKFLWMAWSSTVLMFITAIVWFMDYYVERKLLLREIEQMYAVGAMEPTAKYHDRYVTKIAKDALAHAAGITIAGAITK
ncbi:Sur7 protein [Neofusicoccum parvum]|uniref:Sur7 protein n=1 Tax=Neofusicoccum parvum TaxID=310453 RepID=A0ACB5S868_9PEZI|nr:Sur7 protein [Neofusicoccum parvum]GME38045.1 Sur7 protein [Neofusicoccum parvum]